MGDFGGGAGLSQAASAGDAGRGFISTRREVVRRGAVAGTAILGGAALFAWRPEAAGTAPSAALDRKIFRFALQLEYLQADFYAAAVDEGALRGEALEFAEVVGGHEQEHVEFLERALGAAKGERPAFDFGDATRDRRSFLDTAVLLENTGVAAYNGQAANLTKKALAPAASIVSVEGRHAAWASSLAGREPAPRAADPGATAAAVAAILKKTGFLR